ncbi:MAG: glycosyltransferase [Candidatus Giovannonibacteria bacterium]|nr:MAG: glycosyltransferase [Candidatus Giovannonibacteria bacterium]
MISGDPGVLEPQSETGKRTEEYRKALGKLDVLVCRGSIFSFIFGFLGGLKILWRNKYDVITAQDVEHTLLAWVFSKFFKTPFQMQIHADIMSPYFRRESLKNKIRVALAKFLVPRADCARVVSERIKNSILRTSDVRSDVRRPIIVLSIFVDTEKIKNSPIKTDLHKKYPGRFIILMASRITKEKNIGLAIEAVKGLITHPLNPLLLIVGDGPEIENLKFKTYKLGLNENIVFEPHTDDLISYYKTCDLFLLTSNYEGYGRTLVEAAAASNAVGTAGAKIISSDVGIAPEILEPECIFKVGDKNNLIEKLNSVFLGNIKTPKLLVSQTKEDYLGLYKSSFEVCAHKK